MLTYNCVWLRIVQFTNLISNLQQNGCRKVSYHAKCYLSGPVSVERFPEGDDEVDVDVEQCSDSEAPSRSRTPRSTSNNSRATPHSDEERLSPEPVRKKQVNFKSLQIRTNKPVHTICTQFAYFCIENLRGNAFYNDFIPF